MTAGVKFRVALSRLLALLVLACLVGTTAHARTIPGEACIARIAPGQDVAALMASPAAFDCRPDQARHGQGDYLVHLRFAPVMAKPGDPLVLRLTSVWQDSARVTYHFADGATRHLDYSAADSARFLKIGAIFELPVPLRDAALDGVFIQTRNSANLRGVVISPRVMTLRESFRENSWLVAIYAAFAGLTLALVVYNLALWSALRHRFQLLYCGMVTVLVAYTASSSGLLMKILPWMDNNDRLRINCVLLAMSGAMALQFVRHFFEPDIFGPRLRWMIKWSIALALAGSLAFALLAPWRIGLLDTIYYITLTVMLSTIFPILISAWRNRSRYFWMFILAWSAPIVTSVLRAAHGFNLVPHSFWLDNGNLVALTIEALLSSVMITARLRELSLERDEAIAGEQFARRLAATDPLTGLLNRRAFLDLAIGRKARQRLLLIDIDHFKAVNDRLGHEGGDRVLECIAEAIQACRPPRSLAVRLGGEEFALLVPRSAFDACPPTLLLDTIRQHEMPQGLQVTVSIGFADGSIASEADWKRLYRLADAALYRAKADGRDRACRATDFRVAA